MGTAFGEEIKRLRKLRGLKQTPLAELAGVSQVSIHKWESGKSQAIDKETLNRLASALGVDPSALAQHLPAEHNARRATAVEIPVAGVVAAGAARDEPADADSRLSVSEIFAGCVSYLVRGRSMEDDQIRDGDYLIVKPAADREPAAGDVVVAWIRDKNAETGGHVVKRLEKGNYLKSAGKGRWSHKLAEGDQVFGVLVGVVRVCS
jgi:transcriptional regulator with XRE-family HTH domain